MIAASATSLLIGLATIALWVRSFSVADLITEGHALSAQDQAWWTFGSSRGQLLWNQRHWYFTGLDRSEGRFRLTVGPLRRISFDPYLRYASDLAHHVAGFGWQRQHFVDSVNPNCILNRDSEYLAIPLWSLALLLVLPPGVILRRLWLTRYRQGHCQACGYDLRASNDRCPECGTVIAAHSKRLAG